MRNFKIIVYESVVRTQIICLILDVRSVNGESERIWDGGWDVSDITFIFIISFPY